MPWQTNYGTIFASLYLIYFFFEIQRGFAQIRTEVPKLQISNSNQLNYKAFYKLIIPDKHLFHSYHTSNKNSLSMSDKDDYYFLGAPYYNNINVITNLYFK